MSPVKDIESAEVLRHRRLGHVLVARGQFFPPPPHGDVMVDRLPGLFINSADSL